MEHHAYYVEGPQSLKSSLVASACKQFNFQNNSPDLHVLEFEKFGIDDAHELTRQAALKSVSNRALFIIAISITNVFAQQALLKLLEEPQQGVTFVLLVPPGSLMPTIKSRLLRYSGKLQFDEQNSLGATRGLFEQQIATFLKSSYKDRSAQITALLKDDEGVRERVRDFVNSIEAALHHKQSKEARAGLEDVAKVRSYLNDQSPSLKMLLEHLAVTLPKFS